MVWDGLRTRSTRRRDTMRRLHDCRHWDGRGERRPRYRYSMACATPATPDDDGDGDPDGTDCAPLDPLIFTRGRRSWAATGSTRTATARRTTPPLMPMATRWPVSTPIPDDADADGLRPGHRRRQRATTARCRNWGRMQANDGLDTDLRMGCATRGIAGRRQRRGCGWHRLRADSIR